MRYGWCSALSRLCTRLVMNTVLPARLKPVTARLTVEPRANSLRSNAPESHSEIVVPALSNTDFIAAVLCTTLSDRLDNIRISWTEYAVQISHCVVLACAAWADNFVRFEGTPAE